VGERVLIVGGGVAGLATAGALADAGCAVDVVELQPQWNITRSGITLQPPALRALRDLGVLDAALERGFGITQLQQIDPAGAVRSAISLPRLCGPAYPATVGTLRLALHEVLLGFAEERGVAVRLGATVDRLQEERGGVCVGFADGAEAQYDVVVCADGVGSRMRALLGVDTSPNYSGMVVWRATVPRVEDVQEMQLCSTPEAVIGFVPVSEEQMYIFTPEIVERFSRLAPEDELRLLRDRLAPLQGARAEARDAIREPGQVVRRPIEWTLMPTPWNRGRVVLMGDAVHTAPPTLANGAAMALEDAVVLADCIRAGGPVEERLERFSALRQDRCRLVVELSNQRGELLKGEQKDGSDMLTLERRLAQLLAEDYREPVAGVGS
jgi:2-polyprenyl-6-methoxyphenol hydroxylase-like FAD-dependent oxidoreductase